MSKETSTVFARKTAVDARESLASQVHPERLSVWFLQYSRLTSLVKQLSKSYFFVQSLRILLSIKFRYYLAEWLLAPRT